MAVPITRKVKIPVNHRTPSELGLLVLFCYISGLILMTYPYIHHIPTLFFP